MRLGDKERLECGSILAALLRSKGIYEERDWLLVDDDPAGEMSEDCWFKGEHELQRDVI